jgi:dTDP-4-dehydrorhamnose reductase
LRVLILGGDGMLGHRLLKDLSRSHEVRVTLRQPAEAYADYSLFSSGNSYYGVDARDADRLIDIVSDCQPEAVVNAVGVVKQRPGGLDPIPNLEINALLPHRLAGICKTIRAHFIHISTDCVFSGKNGSYKEDHQPDPIDFYGHSKLLGEVVGPNCITLRTSIIGRELSRKTSLLEWFLAQRGRVPGYKNAVFSGFTTIEMSRIMGRLITRFPASSGIYHVSSFPISKYDLLCLIRDRFGLPVEVIPDYEVKLDRSLDSSRFRREFSYSPPTWESMIEELAVEYHPEVMQ